MNSMVLMMEKQCWTEQHYMTFVRFPSLSTISDTNVILVATLIWFSFFVANLYLGLNWRYFLCLHFSFLFAQVLWYWHSYEREIKLEDIQTPECMTPFSLMFYRITILLGILENIWWSFQDGRECNNVSVCLFTGNGLFKTEEQVILWRQASWI